MINGAPRDDGAPTVDKITAAIALAVRCMSVSVTTAPERAVLQRLVAHLPSLESLRSRLSSLERELDGVRKDAERMDFLERGGFTAFQSSEHKSANVVDCRDNFTKGEGRFYADTIREAIDAAMTYDAAPSALRERSE